MEDNLILESSSLEQPKRSQFLKVLCILSFIMCAFGFLSALWNIYQSTPQAMQQSIESLKDINPEMADQMENHMIEMMENPVGKILPYLGLVYALLSFLAVMMMWNLKRTGFYIYVVAEILPYSSFLFLGKSSLSMMGPPGANNELFAMIGFGLMVIVDLVFIILYSRNLKEMNK